VIRSSPAGAGIALALLVLLGFMVPCAGAIRMQPQYWVGDTITLTGTTNLASGDPVSVDIISASFAPAEKGEDTTFSGSSGIVTVDHGTWSYTFSTAGFRQDQYLVTVEAIGIGVIDKGSFRLIDRPVETTGTTIPTQGATTGGTMVPTTESPAATPKAGGSPELLALSVLLFYLISRRA